jgi:hypothetical protein
MALLLAAVVLAPGCGEDSIELPAEFSGYYDTSDPRYIDRYFELSPDEVRLGLGDGETMTHTIRSIQRQEQDGKTFYTVAYSTGEGPDQLTFTQRDGGALVMKNQPTVVWERREEAR